MLSSKQWFLIKLITAINFILLLYNINNSLLENQKLKSIKYKNSKYSYYNNFINNNNNNNNINNINNNNKNINISNNNNNNNNNNDYIIPNIVHYIWYANEPLPLKFHHMLSILSAEKILKPDYIFFHTNLPPIGKYWEAVNKLDNFIVNFRQPPLTLFGEKVKEPLYYTSHSNVDRVKILMESGGIYLDLDVIVVKSFDTLRKFPCVIGKEQEDQACGSIILCHKDSPFLLLWINSYLDDYKINIWAYNSGKVPYNLAKRFPHLIHLDQSKLNIPNFDQLELIWGKERFDWTSNYAVHIWYRLWKDKSEYYKGEEPNENNIKYLNNCFGEMARAILYGDPGLMDWE